MQKIRLSREETMQALKIGATEIALNRDPSWQVKRVYLRLEKTGVLFGAIVEVEAVEKSDET